MAVMDEFCMKQVDNEISIINENISKSDFVYQDSFGDVEFLGFAHSHPQETELRYSIYDTENILPILFPIKAACCSYKLLG